MTICERTNVLLDKIFKHQGWLKHAVSLGANPVFLGYDLIDFFNGVESSMNLALISMEFDGDLRCPELLESLKESKYFNEELAEYSVSESNITLNIWEALKRTDHTKVPSFEKLFTQESTTLRTAILYYNGGLGHFESLVVENHALPWKKRYEVDLPLCRNVRNPTMSPTWVFTLYAEECSDKDFDLIQSRLCQESKENFSLEDH